MMKRIFSAAAAAILIFLTGWTQIIPLKAESALSSDIVSDYAYVFDTDTSQVLMDKNAEEKMYPASMTKIMTAIIVIENDDDLDRHITITSDMLAGLAEMNASVAGFQENDDPTVRDLLYGLALPSGADAANALAIDLCGDIPSFVERMNQKALALDLNSTHFANVTGLHDDDHYSTAKDIGRLLQYCIQDPIFAEIFSSASYTTSSLPSAGNGIVLRSTAFQAIASNGYSVDGFIGAKTGYTDEAGHCMASWDTVNDMHLIAVTAHADTSIYASTHIQDLETILNDLHAYEKKNILSADDPLKDIAVHALFHSYAQTIYVPQDLILDVPSDADIEYTSDLPDEIDLSNDDQEIAYTVRISVNGALYQEYAETCMIPKDTNPITRILRSIKNLFQ
ncbi:MAG: serine hydrolase [Solobacterium sp.]|nr:serine hydrolase [Solobacterium sp.]MCH4206306.1 serine hydrolase [Solobacterium sp.]MCH4227772.1 serine hydrolase [Solobacterium sp.]MCH4283195.1 serine hydrolase [Solobacterium sp.]